ncbi:protein kinase C and casein kinase substrate in neurons protein Synd [Brevipalpus obovatus]|uniref:protein kinase C and casein kinase substrate in neurons protein Synd n=1 Tax=Brevipalpus obovatus TaxID=246614 RepID=UPI003D9F3FD1
MSSHHSDDGLMTATSDSFWEPGNYKRTTKRTEDGFKLCNDLVQLIAERSEIEKNYGKSLRTWSKKWNEIIEKGPEYGTTEAAWKSVDTEAEKRCLMHLSIKDKLMDEVVPQIKQWQKDNYHKSMIHLKEKKDFDDEFKKAQKTWAKHLDKVHKTKAEYHTACKNERSAINHERNASGDSSLSPDQVKKLQDRVAKCKEEVQKTKEKYEQALREINECNAKYVEEMTVVFEKCQKFEHKRLEFFKKMLFAIHDCLNISANPELPIIYEEYRHTIQNADANKDLKWWSNNNGVGMAMNWPIFEEYIEEFRDIIGKTGKKSAIAETGITLVNQHKFNEELPEYTTDATNGKKDKKNTGDTINVGQVNIVNNSLNNHKNGKIGNGSSNRDSTINGNGKTDHTPFDDDHEEWDDDVNDALVDNGEPGVPVRALYDYEGAESDELSFKQGDVFEKLEDEDEQGWCKGRKDGRVGLYPANYVEPTAT